MMLHSRVPAFAGVLSALFASAALADDAPLFLPAQPAEQALAPALSDQAAGTVRRARPVKPDFARLDAVSPGERIRLDLFDDLRLAALVDRIDVRDEVRYTWTGSVTDAPGGSFVLTVEDDAVMGAVWLDDHRAFEIRSDARGVLWSTELNQAGFAPCAVGPEHCVHAPAAPEDARRPVRGDFDCTDDAGTIDVLIAYTPAVRQFSGGTNAAIALAHSAIASANNAYEHSGIHTRLRLVHAAETAYSEGDHGSNDLARLRSTNDGHMDELHQLRTEHRADMVALLSNSSGVCGIAYLMTNLSTNFRSSAFSVTVYHCAVGNLSFAHELGHNMGSAHDHDNAGGALFPYSYGHRWYGTNAHRYRSVMAYSPGSRVPRFSNPDVSYAGTPTGVPQGQPNPADNARSINEASWTIANFLTEHTRPTIERPEDAEATVGERVTLSAPATGVGALTYQWYKDHFSGPTLVENTDRISGADGPELVFDPVMPEDDGRYWAEVSNACGTAPSGWARLTVLFDCPADIAPPFGQYDLFDLVTFLQGLEERWPEADLAAPFGAWDVFDLLAFLDAYTAGCP